MCQPVIRTAGMFQSKLSRYLSTPLQLVVGTCCWSQFMVKKWQRKGDNSSHHQTINFQISTLEADIIIKPYECFHCQVKKQAACTRKLLVFYFDRHCLPLCLLDSWGQIKVRLGLEQAMYPFHLTKEEQLISCQLLPTHLSNQD